MVQCCSMRTSIGFVFELKPESPVLVTRFKEEADARWFSRQDSPTRRPGGSARTWWWRPRPSGWCWTSVRAACMLALCQRRGNGCRWSPNLSSWKTCRHTGGWTSADARRCQTAKRSRVHRVRSKALLCIPFQRWVPAFNTNHCQWESNN